MSLRRAARRDANHTEIQRIFEKMLAGEVTDSSSWGKGAGDLFVSSGIACAFIEIKDGGTKKLTPAQIKFRATHPEHWYRVDTIEAAMEVATLLRKLGRRK